MRSTTIAGALVSFAPIAACGGQVPAAVADAAPTPGTEEAAAIFSTVEVDASATLINDSGTACPGISSFSVTPTALGPYLVAELAIEAVGPLASVEWTASPSSGGTFSDPTLPQTMFLCAGPGLVTIEVQVQLEGVDAADACAGTLYSAYTTVIGCESVDAGGP